MAYMQKRGRKAQITIFIIIGIVLLFSSALVIYVKNQVKMQPLEELKVVTESVPLAAQPVQEYVGQCLKESTQRGLRLILEHGGYIGTNPEDTNYTKRSFKINPVDNTASDVVTFAPGSSYRVPYWYHMKSNNLCSGNCQFGSEMPELYRPDGASFPPADSSVESQLDRYIINDLDRCINDFTPFKNQGMSVTPLGPISPKTYIRDEDVMVVLSYPLELKIGESKFQLNTFNTQVQNHIKMMFELGKEIVWAQDNYKFLEKETINMLSAYSLDIDTTKLPPQSYVEWGIAPKIWMKNDVDDRIKSLLSIYTPLTVIQNTGSYMVKDYPDPFKKAFYNLAQMPSLTQATNSYQIFKTSFSYNPWFGMYSNYKCRGCGQVIKPEFIGVNIVIPIGLQRYATNYDLSFPTLVMVSDYSANPDGDFLFFAIEQNIRDTEVINSSFQAKSFAPTFDQSLLCTPEQKTSGNISIRTVDAYTGQPVADVLVSYGCIDSCFVGVSNSSGEILTKLPPCMGGVIYGQKAGYYADPAKFDAPKDKSKTAQIIIPLWEKKKVNITVMKKSFVKDLSNVYGTGDIGLTPAKWLFVPTPKKLEAKESATIMLVREKTSEMADDFFAFAQFTGDKDVIEMELIPGVYTGNIYLMYNGTVVVPEKTFVVEDQPVKLDKLEFKDTFFEGQTMFEITPNIPPEQRVLTYDPSAIPENFSQGLKKIYEDKDESVPTEGNVRGVALKAGTNQTADFESVIASQFPNKPIIFDNKIYGAKGITFYAFELIPKMGVFDGKQWELNQLSAIDMGQMSMGQNVSSAYRNEIEPVVSVTT